MTNLPAGTALLIRTIRLATAEAPPERSAVTPAAAAPPRVVAAPAQVVLPADTVTAAR